MRSEGALTLSLAMHVAVLVTEVETHLGNAGATGGLCRAHTVSTALAAKYVPPYTIQIQ